VLINYYYFLLLDTQKNLEMEKKKFDKVKETLTKTEEELKDLKKVQSPISIYLQTELFFHENIIALNFIIL